MSTLQAVRATAPDPPCGEFDIEAPAPVSCSVRAATAVLRRSRDLPAL